MSQSLRAAEQREKSLPPAAANKSSSTATEGRTVLPPSIEIAKIAAVLCRDNQLEQEAAIDAAIALILKTAIRYDELLPLRADQIISKLGDASLLDWALKQINGPKKLRLYPDNAKLDVETRSKFFESDLDQVRSYLQKKAAYLSMLKSRSVLDTIRLYFLKTAYDHNDRNAQKILRLEKRIARLAKRKAKDPGRTLTIDLVRNGMKLTEDQLRRDGEREYEDFMDRAAVRAEGKSEGHHFRPGEVLYWELLESFLDKLIVFRRKVKEAPGGIRTLRDRLSKSSTKKNRNTSEKSYPKKRNLES